MALQDYYPLDPEKQEVRLLSLEPGRCSDDIHIRLHHHSLSEIPRPNYEALSYVWGSRWDPLPVQIRKDNGQTRQILLTSNLFFALKQLRHEQSTRVLWVDAICIDQNNVVERNQQVAMMGNIYRCATLVIAWLGLEDDDSLHAVQYMNELGSKINVNWITNDIEIPAMYKTCLSTSGYQLLLVGRREYEAIYHFIMRPWFERLWIIQEITLGSKNGILLCGGDSISWKLFLDAFLCIYCRVISPDFGDLYASFQTRGRLVYQLAILQTYGSIEYLREQLGQSKCSDPRDRIYGVLNILHENDQKIGIYPDYSKTVTHIYQTTAVQWIKHNRRLDILASCQMTTALPADLPSWVPDWSTPLAFQPLWRPDDMWKGSYVPFSFPTDKTLRSFGVSCARVSGRFDLAWLKSDIDPREFCDQLRKILSISLQAASVASGNHFPTDETIQEAVCRTLIFNMFSDAFYPPRPSRERYEDCVCVVEGSSRNTVSSMTSTYSALAAHFSRGRCFFTTEEGYIGMAPSSAQTADIVCNILGCEKPLLLRPIAKEANTNIYYQLIGECYIHGLMACETILGQFPANYRQVFYYNNDEGRDIIGYLNCDTKSVTKEDPRTRRQEVIRVDSLLRKTIGISGAGVEHGVKTWRDAGVNLMPFDII